MLWLINNKCLTASHGKEHHGFLRLAAGVHIANVIRQFYNILYSLPLTSRMFKAQAQSYASKKMHRCYGGLNSPDSAGLVEHPEVPIYLPVT